MGAAITTLTPGDFFALTEEAPGELLRRVRDDGEALVVKGFLDGPRLGAVRGALLALRRAAPPQWHPCLDGCPDYHRINDEYPASYVRGKLRVYYFHRWNGNGPLFAPFAGLFALKNRLGGEPVGAHYDTLPSSGVVSRLAVNHFPRGGGYLSEHVDPGGPFALLQTVVHLSTFGRDYASGGLYARRPGSAEPLFLDPATEAGDLLVLSPGVSHGVAPVDREQALDWEREDGRLTILPIIMRSDYVTDPATRSRPSRPA